MNGRIKIQFLNNEGGGFSEEKELPAGTTIGELIASHTNLGDVAKYSISLNGNSGPSRTQQLQNGDRVTIAPLNVKGA